MPTSTVNSALANDYLTQRTVITSSLNNEAITHCLIFGKANVSGASFSSDHLRPQLSIMMTGTFGHLGKERGWVRREKRESEGEKKGVSVCHCYVIARLLCTYNRITIRAVVHGAHELNVRYGLLHVDFISHRLFLVFTRRY